MSATIPVSNGNWSKSSDDAGGVGGVDVSWVERVVRLEERLSALTARVATLEARPHHDPEIIECLTEIGELLEEAIASRGEGEGIVDEIARAPGAVHHLLRRSVFAVFAVVLFVLSKLLEPGGSGVTFKIGG